MKKLIIIPLFLAACTPKETANVTSSADSVAVSDQDIIANHPDSSVVILDSTSQKPSENRKIDGDKIIHTLEAKQIPITISDEFTNADQQLIIKIHNHQTGKISGTLEPQSKMMNIRFNQIKLPDGNYDGPFGRDINYDIKNPGEVWLIIAKSNMASGDATGKFSVTIR